MVRWLGILLRTFRSAVRTRRELALENLALRQQLAVWKARQPRPRLTEMDRIFWVPLSRLWTSWQHSLQVVRPETVVGWHRQRFRRYWAWKSRARRGRPRISREVRALIRRMSGANEERQRSHRVGFLHGAHGDLSSAVRARDADPQQAAAGAFECDGASTTAEWTARQLLEACALGEAPRDLIRDRHQVYGERFSRQAQTLGTQEAAILPRPPSQKPYAVRVICFVRRGSLR